MERSPGVGGIQFIGKSWNLDCHRTFCVCRHDVGTVMKLPDGFRVKRNLLGLPLALSSPNTLGVEAA